MVLHRGSTTYSIKRALPSPILQAHVPGPHGHRPAVTAAFTIRNETACIAYSCSAVKYVLQSCPCVHEHTTGHMPSPPAGLSPCLANRTIPCSAKPQVEVAMRVALLPLHFIRDAGPLGPGSLFVVAG